MSFLYIGPQHHEQALHNYSWMISTVPTFPIPIHFCPHQKTTYYVEMVCSYITLAYGDGRPEGTKILQSGSKNKIRTLGLI